MVQEADIEDVIQEVFFRLTRMEDLDEKLHPDSRAQRAFLLTITNNILVDFFRKTERINRKKAKATDIAQTDFVQPVNNPESLLSQAEDVALVKSAIASLKPNVKQAFYLNRFKYFSYREISEVMGVSTKQVEKYMQSALLAIRECLPNCGGGRNEDI